MNGKENFNGVQALRFIAALLVVITHSTFYASERLMHGMPYWHAGASGVNIFFVISGFVMVVSTSKLVGRSDGWSKFLARRLIRIVPMYWIATGAKLLVMLTAPGAVLHSKLTLGYVLASFLFIPTVNVEGEFKPLLAVGWTLYFEMFFYVLFALALFTRQNRYVIVGAVLSLFAGVSLFRGKTWSPMTMFFDPLVLQFFMGMLIAAVVECCASINAIMQRYPAIPLVSVGLGAAALLLLFDVDWLWINFAFRTGIASMAIVLGVIWLEPLWGKKLPKSVLLLGDSSYSLYLFHPLVAPAIPVVLFKIGVNNYPICILLSIVSVLIIGVLIHLLVERPLTCWLKKYFTPRLKEAL